MYLTRELSDDAVPTIVDALPSLAEPDRAQLRSMLCAAEHDDRGGLLEWNRSASAADAARRGLC